MNILSKINKKKSFLLVFGLLHSVKSAEIEQKSTDNIEFYMEKNLKDDYIDQVSDYVLKDKETNPSVFVKVIKESNSESHAFEIQLNEDIYNYFLYYNTTGWNRTNINKYKKCKVISSAVFSFLTQFTGMVLFHRILLNNITPYNMFLHNDYSMLSCAGEVNAPPINYRNCSLVLNRKEVYSISFDRIAAIFVSTNVIIPYMKNSFSQLTRISLVISKIHNKCNDLPNKSIKLKLKKLAPWYFVGIFQSFVAIYTTGIMSHVASHSTSLVDILSSGLGLIFINEVDNQMYNAIKQDSVIKENHDSQMIFTAEITEKDVRKLPINNLKRLHASDLLQFILLILCMLTQNAIIIIKNGWSLPSDEFILLGTMSFFIIGAVFFPVLNIIKSCCR